MGSMRLGYEKAQGVDNRCREGFDVLRRTRSRCGRAHARRGRTGAAGAGVWFGLFGQQSLLSCGVTAWRAGCVVFEGCGAHDDELGVGAAKTKPRWY